jgi:hypothetical protein
MLATATKRREARGYAYRGVVVVVELHEVNLAVK